MRLHLANVGRAAPHLCQRLGDRPAQLRNRFVGEDRPRVCEPVDAHVEGGHRLFQSRDLGLKDWIFSCLEFPKGVAKARGLPQSSFGDSPARPWTADQFLTTPLQSLSRRRFRRNCRCAQSRRAQESQRRSPGSPQGNKKKPAKNAMPSVSERPFQSFLSVRYSEVHWPSGWSLRTSPD